LPRTTTCPIRIDQIRKDSVSFKKLILMNSCLTIWEHAQEIFSMYTLEAPLVATMVYGIMPWDNTRGLAKFWTLRQWHVVLGMLWQQYLYL
jgi:hypothetical protein